MTKFYNNLTNGNCADNFFFIIFGNFAGGVAKLPHHAGDHGHGPDHPVSHHDIGHYSVPGFFQVGYI